MSRTYLQSIQAFAEGQTVIRPVVAIAVDETWCVHRDHYESGDVAPPSRRRLVCVTHRATGLLMARLRPMGLQAAAELVLKCKPPQARVSGDLASGFAMSPYWTLRVKAWRSRIREAIKKGVTP